MLTGKFGIVYPSAEKRNGPFGLRYYTMIYAIDAPEFGRIKFGKTGNIKKRFGGIASMAPCPLTLLGYVWLPEEAEAAIFQYVAEDRCHGEWFRATERVRGIAALIAAKRDVELGRELNMAHMLMEDVPSGVSWGRQL